MNDTNKLQQLLEQVRQRVETAPDDWDAVTNLAVILVQLGQSEQALSILLAAVEKNPQHLGLQHNLAELYRNKGEQQKAETLFIQLINSSPQFVPAYQSLILILAEQLANTQQNSEQHKALLNRLAILSNNKGNALLASGQIEAAYIAYNEALRYWYHYPSAHSNLSNVARLLGHLSEAELNARTALAMNSNFAEAWNNLGTALSEQGRCTEAMHCYQQALNVNPEQPEARHNAGSGSLFLQLYREDLTADQVVQAHKQWGDSMNVPPLPCSLIVTDKLRIGFISADFREHAMMHFVEPLLEKLDRNQFEIICYANQTMEDAVTERIKALPLLWRPIAQLSDKALCQQIQQDQVHILIDLNGHSKGHRLYALAYKPAPIMATWLGYLFTTGLAAFDYRISDLWSDPKAYAASQHTEQLAYLKYSQFTYRPKANTPDVNALPALNNGFITFGSLNNIQKLNRRVVWTWSKILSAVPNSRLLLQSKLLIDAGVAGRIRGLFEAFGIDAERLEFRQASNDHLNTYHHIDIALDTFPYTGGATTCDALWMGVPVLSLIGDRSVARSGVSILSALEMGNWLANSMNDYIALAQQHSESLDTLASLRQTLRNRFQQSSLGDEDRFALDFARCLKQMVKQKLAS